MKKYLFLLFTASWICSIANAQVFVIERENATLTFSNIKAAVDALHDNDRLYIPPGTFSLVDYVWEGYDGDQNIASTLVVNKKVSIYGAGYTGGSSSAITNGSFIIGRDAGGTSISGLRFDYCGFYLDNVSNCIISRCKTSGSVFSLDGTGYNNLITECEINGGGGNGATIQAGYSKCIFREYYPHCYGATVNNCLFWIQSSMSNFENCSLSNNIFIVSTEATDNNTIFSGNNNTFSYNLWVGGSIFTWAAEGNTFSNEITNEPYANVFVDPYNGDYHLKAECRGKNAGSDGTDTGIFGTSVPFKESRLPVIPHFNVRVVSFETDAEGKLPVNIQIEAQDN
ncbi:hypothetical protein FACS189413_08650 [Bacteroidia bacterium]|nr:hypothetical protein FACS189413_08650 [Bacteroidia bacterium]